MGFDFLLADQNASFWFPQQASSFAAEVDWFFWAVLWISAFFFVLIVATMFTFMVRFRRRPGYRGDSKALHNNLLEITWTVIPTIIVIWIFARGVYGYMDMVTPPADTIDINVTARKWDWSFQYPNGAIADTLHIPVDKPVRLLMRSEDVLHSFFVPAFRAKTDVVPGRVTTMWFEPIREGAYDLFCAEYCGDQHSEMIKRHGIVVHSEEEYEAWLADAAKPPEHPVAHGYWLYSRMGCKSCHAVQEGKRIVGPSFYKAYGESFKNTAGETVAFDDAYIRESILEPQAQAREGYGNASQMPSFQGKLNEQELTALTYFIRAMTEDDGFISAVADGDFTDAEAESLGYVASEEVAGNEEEESSSETNPSTDEGESGSESTSSTDEASVSESSEAEAD